MTKLIGIIKDSIGNPVTGYLTVKLNAPLTNTATTPDSVHYDKEYVYYVLNGNLETIQDLAGVNIPAGIVLLPTDEATYRFEFKYISVVKELYLDGKLYASILPNGESTGGDYHQYNDPADSPDMGLQYYTGAVHSASSQLLSLYNRNNRIPLFEPFNTNIPDQATLEWSTLQHSSVNTSNINTSLQYIAGLITQGSLLQALVAGIYNPAGDWNVGTQYQKGDVVYYPSTKGSYWYINNTPSTGNLPSNTTYWQQLVLGTEIGGVSADFLLDTVFGVGWNGVTNKAPTADKLYDYLITLARLDALSNFTAGLQSLTRTAGDSTTHVATTQFVQQALAAFSPPPATTAPTVEQTNRSTAIVNTTLLKRTTNLYARIQEEFPQGDNGGSGQGWRNLEFVKDNAIYNAAATVNMVVGGIGFAPYVQVRPGRYRVRGMAACCGVEGTRLELRTQGGAVLIQGLSGHSGFPGYQTIYYPNYYATLKGTINITVDTNIGLFHSMQITGTNTDRGRACNRGGNEVYASLELWRLDEAA